MREIKFRYVCTDVDGDVFTFVVSIETLERAKLNVNTYGRIETIKARNEFTGLKDKNGKEVWEGDIFKWQLGHVESIVWDEELNGWSIDKVGLATGEVIGNIYDNPELLEVKL